MTLRTIETEQRFAAKVAGFLYLFTMATAIFGESYVRGRLIVRGDAVQTATNIVASERLFRIGVASDLITFAGVVVLVWALYVILKPINRNVALLAAFLRLVECAICAASVPNRKLLFAARPGPWSREHAGPFQRRGRCFWARGIVCRAGRGAAQPRLEGSSPSAGPT